MSLALAIHLVVLRFAKVIFWCFFLPFLVERQVSLADIIAATEKIHDAMMQWMVPGISMSAMPSPALVW
jgi:hypothetical protein